MYMISVPNLRPLLSGNKYIALILAALFVGCSPATKLQKDKQAEVITKSDPIKQEGQKPPSVKDTTAVIPEVKTDVPTAKDGDKDIQPVKKFNHFDLAVVLPFNPNENNERFLQYYGGMKLAADELQLEGYDLTVKVYNAKDANLLASLQAEPTQLIFAPSEEQTLKQILDWGKANNISVVSPFFSLSSVENAPQYVQLKPSLRSHFASMVKHAIQRFPLDDIVLVGRNTKNDKAWFKFFQSTASELLENQAVQPIQEYFVLDDSLTTGSHVFTDLINSGKKVFIFPNYSYKDELYLYNAMRRLLAEKGTNMVTVYGMPILKDSEKMGFDFFSGLNLHVPASRYVDETREEVKSFDRKFFDRYGALPEGDAYEGFDHFLFIGRHLSQYGQDFPQYLSTDNGQYLQARFDVRAVHTEGSSTEIDFFENKYLEILYFDGTRFIQAY